jgi:hypothetical protein
LSYHNSLLFFYFSSRTISDFITRKKAKKDFYLFVDVTQTIYFFSLSEKSMSYVLDEALKAFYVDGSEHQQYIFFANNYKKICRGLFKRTLATKKFRFFFSVLKPRQVLL